MRENNFIKGEYCFDINIYTMFHTFNIQLKNHNLITQQGIDFFLNKCVYNPAIVESENSDGYELDDNYGVINRIAVGTNTKSPSLDDTYLQNMYSFTDTKIEIENNKIILTTNTDGVNIDGTSEIGVFTTQNLLISRDVHSEYTVPSTSTVKLTYVFTLSQTDLAQEEMEQDEND